jgi:hypothetical protein
MAKADRIDNAILPTVTPIETISELTSWRPRSPRAIAVLRFVQSSLPGVSGIGTCSTSGRVWVAAISA